MPICSMAGALLHPDIHNTMQMLARCGIRHTVYDHRTGAKCIYYHVDTVRTLVAHSSDTDRIRVYVQFVAVPDSRALSRQ